MEAVQPSPSRRSASPQANKWAFSTIQKGQWKLGVKRNVTADCTLVHGGSFWAVVAHFGAYPIHNERRCGVLSLVFMFRSHVYIVQQRDIVSVCIFRPIHTLDMTTLSWILITDWAISRVIWQTTNGGVVCCLFYVIFKWKYFVHNAFIQKSIPQYHNSHLQLVCGGQHLIYKIFTYHDV